MIYFASFLLGGTLGIGLWLYVSGFIPRLQSDVYASYVELFPKNHPPFEPHFACFQGKKCGHILTYFFIGGGGLIAFSIATQPSIFSLWLYATLILLWAISYLDWHYQLISPTACLWLFALGLLGATQSFTAITLQESLQSAVIFFLIFYAIYWLAKWYYQKEAFGQGDYWLALGIGSYLPLEKLPLFLLIACILGILFTILCKRTDKFLPFGPFLCSSILVVSIGDYYL